MKLKIKTEDTKINLYFPTLLVLSNLGISIALYVSRKYVSIPEEKKNVLIQQLKICRKQHKGLTLIEVHSKEGEEVIITL